MRAISGAKNAVNNLSDAPIGFAKQRSSDYIVMPIDDCDFAAIAAMERALPMLQNDAWHIRAITDSAKMHGFGGLVAKTVTQNVVGGTLIGYLLYQETDSIELLRLGVAQNWQGCGVGGALMAAWMAAFVGRAFLLEVRADNKRAIGFYRRLGFECIHKRRGYYRVSVNAKEGISSRQIDAWVMARAGN